MSNLQFDSLRHEISHYVHESREPLSAKRLMEICGLATDERQIANIVYLMVKDEQLTKSPAPGGAGAGVRWLYGPGKNKPGAEASRGNAAGGGGPKAKGKREKIARRAGKKKRAAPVRKAKRVPRETPAAQWALTEGGTFVLLGSRKPVEVEPNVARKLLDLVRAGADLAGLAAFIERLDQGQA